MGSFEASFVDEPANFQEQIDAYDARFPRGSCRRDAHADRVRYAKSLPDGVLGLRKAPKVRFDLSPSATITTRHLRGLKSALSSDLRRKFRSTSSTAVLDLDLAMQYASTILKFE